MERHANSIQSMEKKFLIPYKPALFKSLYKEVLVGKPAMYVLRLH
jgi:hypothetical protein